MAALDPRRQLLVELFFLRFRRQKFHAKLPHMKICRPPGPQIRAQDFALFLTELVQARKAGEDHTLLLGWNRVPRGPPCDFPNSPRQLCVGDGWHAWFEACVLP